MWTDETEREREREGEKERAGKRERGEREREDSWAEDRVTCEKVAFVYFFFDQISMKHPL